MRRWKKSEIFSLITLLLIFALLTTPVIVGGVTENGVFFLPQYSNAEFGNTTTVEIMIDAENFQSGQINLTYDRDCANVTNWKRNSTNFPMGGWDSSTDGEEWITFLALSPLTGEYSVGTLTIHGVCEEAASTSTLDFMPPSALFDPYGAEITAYWVDGGFACAQTPTPTPPPTSTSPTDGGSGREDKGRSPTPTSTLTPTISPTPEPSLSPTSMPISSLTPSFTPTSIPSIEQEPVGVPGFEAFFTLIGLLAVGYIVRN